MIMNMTLLDFTTFHVLLSLLGLFSGLAVVGALLTSKWPNLATAVFLTSTVLTSITGFMFPSAGLGPPQIVGVISLIFLALACGALYAFHLKGPWRLIYVASVVVAFYFNAFVGVTQAFAKIPALKELAASGLGGTYAAAELAVLALFLLLGLLAGKHFHPKLAQSA